MKIFKTCVRSKTLDGKRYANTLKDLGRRKLCQKLWDLELSWCSAQWRIFFAALIEIHQFGCLEQDQKIKSRQIKSVISVSCTCQRFQDSMNSDFAYIINSLRIYIPCFLMEEILNCEVCHQSCEFGSLLKGDVNS